MIHLRSAYFNPPSPEQTATFPWSVPVVQSLSETELVFPSAVTFLVGENGSGKSTLLEALACASRAITVGSESVERDATLAAARALAKRMRLAWSARKHAGFFMRRGFLRLCEEAPVMIFDALKAAIEAEQAIAVATIMSGAEVGAKLLLYPDGRTLGALGTAPQADVAREALAMLARGENGIRSYPASEGEVEVFIESYLPPATLFIVGAVHTAIALVTFAKTLGFRTIVVDARGAFATPERFAHADELVLQWPDEVLADRLTSNSFVVLLTHDPKLDDPALKVALPSQARYVGALGSPKTHAARVERLRTDGLTEEQLARLHAPIGLKIGARTPEEIAVSIIAEIVAVQRGRT